MGMDHRHDIRPRFIDFAVDKALAVMLLAAIGRRNALERELSNIGLGHDAGRDVARHHIALRVLVMPDADMAEAVENLMIEENEIGRDQIFDEIARGGDEAGWFLGFTGHGYSIPTTAPLMQVAIVPERIERNPNATMSCLRSGHIAVMPPIMIPALPKLAKPHIA
jgi:hypothetical protein